jgi:hypothetical protein
MYKCKDCGIELNEGEGKTFTVCDDCWDRHYHKMTSKETKEETQDELWEEFVHEDMTIEELKAKYILIKR